MSGPLQGGGQEWAAPPKTKLLPPQTAQHTHPNFRYPCSSFKMVAFFCGNQPRPRRKVDHIGAMTFFFLYQQRTWWKLDQPKNFGPSRNKFFPPSNYVLVAALTCVWKKLCLTNQKPHRTSLVGNGLESTVLNRIFANKGSSGTFGVSLNHLKYYSFLKYNRFRAVSF